MRFEIRETKHFVVDRVITSKPRSVKLYEFDLFGDVNRQITIDDQVVETNADCLVYRKPGQVVCSKGRYDNYILTLAVEDSDKGVITKEQMECIPTCFYPTHIEELKNILQKIIRTYQYDNQAETLQNDLHRFCSWCCRTVLKTLPHTRKKNRPESISSLPTFPNTMRRSWILSI